MREVPSVRRTPADAAPQAQERDVLLIVDDNEMNCDMLSRRLQRRGYDTLIACDGQEALSLIEKGTHVDLALLDIMMPRVDGLEVLRRLRETYSMAELPIIMVSAKAQSIAIVQALEEGANDYVTKPIDFPVVLARIRTQMSRKRAEDALRCSEAKNRAMLSAIPDLMLRRSREGAILDCQYHGRHANPLGVAAEALWEEWGAPFPPTFHDWLEKATAVALDTDEMQMCEFQVDGGEQSAGYEARMVVSGSDEVLVLLRDITERQQLKRLRTEYLAILRHDLQTSLSSVHSALQLLSSHVEASIPPQFKVLLRLAYNKSSHLTSLIRDLIDIEQLESGTMRLQWESLSVHDVVHEALQQCRDVYDTADEIHLKLEEVEPGLMVFADRTLLLRALGYLIHNALKFTPSGETVTVRWERPSSFVRVSITDRGPTIPVAFRDRVFQKSAQTRDIDSNADDSGLGMGISKAIIETLNGHIHVEAAQPEGNIFVLEIPTPERVQASPETRL